LMRYSGSASRPSTAASIHLISYNIFAAEKGSSSLLAPFLPPFLVCARETSCLLYRLGKASHAP
jgi:hypothetical protein